MRSVCLFVIFGSAMLAAQSNTVATINRPAAGKGSTGLSKADPNAQAKRLESYGKLPLSFEANRGQANGQVKFLSRGSGYTLFLTGDEAVFSLRATKASGEELLGSRQMPAAVVPTVTAVLRMKLVQANPAANVVGEDELAGKSNYFVGNDPKKWHANVPTYANVKYKNIYSGIDLVYYGSQRQLEYDFTVAPGADPRRIQFDVRGTKSVSQDPHGDLLLRMEEGEIRWRKPIAYQERGGTRQEIAAHYVIKKNRVGLEVAGYDRRRRLVIDPALTYSTYLGGSSDDQALAIAVDASGSAYVIGHTISSDFPTTAGAFETTCSNNCGGGYPDAFVTKLNRTGTALVYSTYLGGTGSTISYGQGIAVDNSGNAHAIGYTNSPDFPTTPGAFQTSCGGGCSNGDDAFVTELNPSGSKLVYSTYLGGSSNDDGYGIALDGSGDAYVIGRTNSTDFPTMNPLQPTYGGGNYDAFVAELNPTGSALIYSTYLGGSGEDDGYSVAVDSSGNAYVTGFTVSPNFPTTPGAFQTNYAGGANPFVTKVNPTGSALVYSTYLGDSYMGYGIAVDTSGDAFVTGDTITTDFPTTPGAFQTTYGGNGDAFVTELNPAGSALVYSTYLGGSDYEQGNGIVIDASGNAYVMGFTHSTNFPTTPGAFQLSSGGRYDIFVTVFNAAGSDLIYSTYLGGTGDDIGLGIAMDASADFFITGYTYSTDFPTTPGTFQGKCAGVCGAGANDAFIAKFVPGDQVWPLLLNFGDQYVGTGGSPQVTTLTNSGSSALNITSINIAGTNRHDFIETNNCGTSLPAGASCNISVTFKPKATGARKAAVTIADDAANSPQKASLTGIGTQAAVTFTPTSLTFPTQVVFTTSAAQPVTLTNTGSGTLLIARIRSTSQFTQTNNCPASLDPQASCTINVRFRPTDKGDQAGAVIAKDNAPGSPQQVPLTGTGTFVKTVPKQLNFGNQPVGTTSLAKQITLTNEGDVAVNISDVSITGADPGDFNQTNNCGGQLASGASCLIKVKFTPLVQGKRTADVSVSDDGGGSPQQATLSGTGT